jgi:ATP-dependent Clp protease adapter protein ClpS
MMKMIVNLMTLEDDFNNIKEYVESLVQEMPGLHNHLAVCQLMDRLHNVEMRLHEAVRQWPQLGLGLTG